jgi:16S rRNA (cytosine967-C5)-methyltransferase
LYITCSVFAKENEEVMNYITRSYGMKLLKMGMITGYHEKADTLFAAVLTNQSA